MKKVLFFCLFIFYGLFFLWEMKAEGKITIVSPEDKIYIFTNTVFIVGKTDEKKIRHWINGKEGVLSSPRAGNFHFLINLDKGLNKIELSGLDEKEKIKLDVYSLMNYKYFVLKAYDSTGPAGFKRYLFHTGEKESLCAECHEMDPMRADRTMCYTLCHKNDVMKWGFMHGPAGEGACLACHDPEGWKKGYPVVVDGGGQICLTCHEGVGTFKKNAHTAAKKEYCMGCHSPHGTTNNFVLWEDGKAKMCYLCHQDKSNKWKTIKDEKGNDTSVVVGMMPYPHKAISDGDCLGCHHPHESDNQYNLRQPAGKLCVETDCHIPISGAIAKHPHPYDLQPTKGSPVAIAKDIFVDDKGNIVCYSCHNPHGSDYPYIFWKPRETLCPSCHSNIEDKEKRD